MECRFRISAPPKFRSAPLPSRGRCFLAPRAPSAPAPLLVHAAQAGARSWPVHAPELCTLRACARSVPPCSSCPRFWLTHAAVLLAFKHALSFSATWLLIGTVYDRDSLFHNGCTTVVPLVHANQCLTHTSRIWCGCACPPSPTSSNPHSTGHSTCPPQSFKLHYAGIEGVGRPGRV